MRVGAKGIVVVTHPSSREWLNNLMKGHEDWRYPITVLVNEVGIAEVSKYQDETDWDVRFLFNEEGGRETGALHQILAYTQLLESFLIHDTMEIKDPEIFKIAFEDYEGKSYALSDHPNLFGMYIGKYRREPLLKARPKEAKDKMDSVEKEETFNLRYCEYDDVVLCEEPLRDCNRFVEKYGRENMLIENKWVRKYKGSWNRWMVN